MKKFLSVIAVLSLVFSPVTPAFAVDYAAAGNPNAVAVDPGVVVNLTDAGCIVTINGGVNLANAAGVTTAVNGDGTLVLSGATTITGTVGVIGSRLGELELTAAGAGVLNGVTFANLVDLQGAATLDVNADLTSSTGVTFAALASGSITYTTSAYTGTISTVTDGGGKVISDGVNSFSGAVGANAGASIGELEVQDAGRSTLNTASFIDVVDLQGAGTLDVNANLTSSTGVSFAAAASGSITFTAANLTGTISTVTDGGGKVIMDGASTISGAVGAAAGTSIGELEIQNAGAGILNGASFIDLIDLQGGGTLDVNAALTSSTGIVFANGATGTFTITNVDLTGTVTSVTDNQGKVIVDGAATTFNSALGTSAAVRLGELEIATASGATLGAASFVKLVDVQGTGTLAINSNLTAGSTTGTDGIRFAAGGTGVVTVADGINVAGVVDGIGGAVGTMTYAGASTISQAIGATQAIADVNIAGGIVSAGANISSTTIDIANNGTLRLTGNITTVGTLATAAAANADLDLQGFTLTHTGNMTFGADSDLNLDLTTSTLAFGNATVSGTLTLPADVDITVNVIGSNFVAGGTTFLVIDGTAGAGVAGGNTVTDNSFVLSFTAGTDAASRDLILTATRANSYTTATTSGNNQAAGAALEQAGKDGATGDMATVLATLDSLATAAEINTAISTMVPDVSGGAIEGSRVLTGNSFTMISNRLGGARNISDEPSGVSSGDMLNGVGVWIQGLGNHMKQDERKGIQGFSANTWGTTIGADKVIDNHFRLGLAGGYGWAGVRSKTPGSPSDNINSFQGTVYGSYDSLDLCKARQGGKKSPEAVRGQVEDSWYVDGMLAFTQNNYDSRREIWLGTTKRVAKADHYAQQYSTNFEAGYKFVFEETKNLEVTPFMSLGYNYLYMNKYKEDGANALNLNVQGEGFHQLEQALGTKLAYPIVAEKVGTFIPSVKAAWLYDYIGDRFETTASFAGGGPSFNTRGAKPAKNGMLFGAELAFLNKGNMTVTGNWDIELKDQFMSNTYYGIVRYDF